MKLGSLIRVRSTKSGIDLTVGPRSLNHTVKYNRMAGEQADIQDGSAGGNGYLIWLVLGAVWLGGLVFYKDAIFGKVDPQAEKAAVTTENPQTAVNAEKKTITQEEILPDFKIAKKLSEKGFIMSDSIGYSRYDEDTLIEREHKSGTEVFITGTSEDGQWLTIREDMILEDSFVPASKVGRF